MNVKTWLAFTGVAALVITALAFSGQRLAHARSQVQSAAVLLDQSTRDAQEIINLRSSQERIGLQERPAQDVIAQVNWVLAEVGVPTQRLKSLTPESDSAVVGGNTAEVIQYRRQSLRLALESMTVTEIGAFLGAWQRSQQVWTPARIELLHSRSQSGGIGSNPKDNVADRYDVTILLTALYVADSSA